GPAPGAGGEATGRHAVSPGTGGEFDRTGKAAARAEAPGGGAGGVLGGSASGAATGEGAGEATPLRLRAGRDAEVVRQPVGRPWRDHGGSGAADRGKAADRRRPEGQPPEPAVPQRRPRGASAAGAGLLVTGQALRSHPRGRDGGSA